MVAERSVNLWRFMVT